MLRIKRVESSRHDPSELFVGALPILFATVSVVIDGRPRDANLDRLRSLIGACRIVAQFPIDIYANIAALAVNVKLRVFWKLALDNRKEVLFQIVCHGRDLLERLSVQYIGAR